MVTCLEKKVNSEHKQKQGKHKQETESLEVIAVWFAYISLKCEDDFIKDNVELNYETSSVKGETGITI